MTSIRPTFTYSNESINEVCSSTASLSVSSINPIRDYDSPTVVSHSSSQSSAVHSDQFEDAPEDKAVSLPLLPTRPPVSSLNPLDALATACAAENSQQQEQVRLTAGGTQTASFQISQNDVLCGRGGLTNHHPGNVFFRRLVRIKQEAYLKASKREKAGVAREIVDLIRSLSPSGRFLKKDPQNPGVWIEIGDRKAREKTSQALREGAPELREELVSEKKQLKEELTETQAPLDHSGDRAMLDSIDSMRQGQDPSWSPQMIQLPMAKPHTVKSNRVRVVSSDSNVTGVRPVLHHKIRGASTHPHVIVDDQPTMRPVYPAQELWSPYRHPQPVDMNEPESLRRPAIGGKRKSVDLGCSFSSTDSSSQSDAATRGPRLKLLKKRLQSGGSS